MPKYSGQWSQIIGNRLIWENHQLQFDVSETTVSSNIEKLNAEQKRAFEMIIDSVETNAGKTFFLNGSAGTGKTFVYNTVAAKCRLKGNIVLTVASCGVAALLLSGGRTSHSTFKILLNPAEDSKWRGNFVETPN
ncbi:ATP-dependent DNA helicase PIF4-like [Papaver somniferum]|uniref:ATP-dependent DNA helicase PIF4-like n=1 Tax=Papaver somniferum TaxID=3469 RepID=UPI000E6FBB85|nr:ATP-dependent DNA helicase PIF4-like [Papaver somniferum]